jgi:rRNA-processing protein FCF1
MLSNNHINELITHRFDFSNEVRRCLFFIFLFIITDHMN